jgi:hypothetical protein
VWLCTPQEETGKFALTKRVACCAFGSMYVASTFFSPSPRACDHGAIVLMESH